MNLIVSVCVCVCVRVCVCVFMCLRSTYAIQLLPLVIARLQQSSTRQLSVQRSIELSPPFTLAQHHDQQFSLHT